MNKLNSEHLYLLLDEPIYVLESDLRDHFESHETTPESEPESDFGNFAGENKKGVLIITQVLLDAEDEEFLFKGLNALDIFAEDVAIMNIPLKTEIPAAISHTKRLLFSNTPVAEMLYQMETKDGVTHLECHSINQIRNNKDLKVSFWLGLKAVFGK